MRIYDPYESFLDKFDMHESGCWLWNAAKNKKSKIGYGVFWVDLKSKKGRNYAHRISYEWFVGEIPDGFRVLHKCDIPICVNPDHLFLGTQGDNVRDMVKKGRKGKPWSVNPKIQCKNGHLYAESGWYGPYKNGKRFCKKCCKERYTRRYYSKLLSK